MDKFDVLVIGGGPGGYLAAERAAQGGLKAAVIEKRALGGTCLNEGCMPTKTLLYCAKQYAAAKHGAEYGVSAENVKIDHAKVVDRKDKVVKALVSGVGSTMMANNIKVIRGDAEIKGKTPEGFEVAVKGGESVVGTRLIIATGSCTSVPPVPGLKEGLASGYVMTNREILDMRELPESIVCMGGGVIGLEMACYFASVGVKVTIIEMLDKIAGPTDKDICNTLMSTYKKEGMEFILSAKVLEIGKDSVTYEGKDGKKTVKAGKVLLSAGRRADVAGVGLENIGVLTERGAVVHRQPSLHECA